MLPNYSSPVNLNNKYVSKFFDGSPYIVQEKIDGSQFSFGVKDGILYCRSHGQQINIQNPGMFDKAVTTVKHLYEDGKLNEGWIYRGEYLSKKKHNRLTYERIPDGYIILFDIDQTGTNDYMHYSRVQEIAILLGLDYAHVIDTANVIPDANLLEKWLFTHSCLGGKIEGIVLKNYHVFEPDGTCMMVKYVNPEFRESGTAPKQETADIVTQIINEFGTEARFYKAVQHLTENGQLIGDPKDIGPLMRELVSDFEKESEGYIKDILWGYFRKSIVKGVTYKFPEWYKQYLLEQVIE